MFDSLEQVAAAVGTLATETRSLAQEVRIENRERKKQNVFQILLTALVLIMMVLLVVQVFRQSSDQAARAKAATEQRRAQLELSQQINDCINPGGACYQRSRTAQGNFLQNVLDANRCTVEADGNPAAFDACLKAKGITVVTPPAPR